MSKRELIDAIIQHNRTANPKFLARFGESDLKAYLDRMCMISINPLPQRMQAAVDSHQQLVLA